MSKCFSFRLSLQLQLFYAKARVFLYSDWIIDNWNCENIQQLEKLGGGPMGGGGETSKNIIDTCDNPLSDMLILFGGK